MLKITIIVKDGKGGIDFNMANATQQEIAVAKIHIDTVSRVLLEQYSKNTNINVERYDRRHQ